MEVHIHIDEIVVDGPFEPESFEASLRGLAESHTGGYPSGSASVLYGQPSTSVAHAVWHSIVPERRAGTA